MLEQLNNEDVQSVNSDDLPYIVELLVDSFLLALFSKCSGRNLNYLNTKNVL